MNCANHPDRPIAKYCRTCGKPLCTDCVREVMGIAYCENCLAERVAGAAPTSSYAAPGTPYTAPPVMPSSGPNPGLAGILGAIPFGVGAVYNGQYAKGLAHLVIFILLVIGASHGHEPLDTICGIGIAAFVFYQIIDAVKTAKAIQLGQPAPDPLGLGTMFSPGERRDITRGAPAGALVLIFLGVLFLLQNTGLWYLRVDALWPMILIALGVWLFSKRKIAAERGDYRHRSLVGPSVLVTLGVVFLLENMHDRWDEVPGFGHTWPVILLVIGVVKLMERGHFGNNPYFNQQPPPGTPPEQQPPSEVNSEVKNG
jgi:hypothetical protein